MKTQSIVNVIQTLTGLAVLVGLGLVIFELRQSRELARAELTAEGWAHGIDKELHVMGENFAEVFANACFRPQELSEIEIIQLEANFYRGMNSLRRRKSYEHIGEGKVISMEEGVQRVLKELFLTEFGRNEYRLNHSYLADWITGPGDALLETDTHTDCGEKFREHLRLLGEPK
jgi:hypothetical protein